MPRIGKGCLEFGWIARVFGIAFPSANFPVPRKIRCKVFASNVFLLVWLKVSVAASSPDLYTPPGLNGREKKGGGMAARKNNGKSAKVSKRVRKRKPVVVPTDYRPTVDEEFMNPVQQEYFKQKLIGWREEILAESSQTIMNLREEMGQAPDIGDRASIESGRLIELRSRDRERKLLSKIQAALQRIEDGSYGYCEETGDPIGLNRLEARPVATLTIDAQERHERMEKTYNDD